MLGTGRDPKIFKDQDENENVIDAERVFDDVAGEKIQAGVIAFRFPDKQIEGERENDPNEASLNGGPHAQLAIAPLESGQIDRQRDEDAHVECDPEPDIRGHRADRPIFASAPQRQSARS